MVLVATGLFLLGAIIASFIGVLSVRLNTSQGFFTGRSRCDACNTVLAPLTLVPILSYVVQRGRAYCCGARISLYAPLTEILLGGLFVLSYYSLGLTSALVGMLFSLSILLALVLYDLAHQILPPSLLGLFLLGSVVTNYLVSPSFEVLSVSYLTALCVGGVLTLIHYGSRGRAMGFADAPLVFGLALLVGPAAIPGFVFSFWIGAVVGIGVLLGRPAGSRMGVEVPFAPFLAAGFLLAYFTQWNPFAFAALLS